MVKVIMTFSVSVVGVLSSEGIIAFNVRKGRHGPP